MITMVRKNVQGEDFPAQSLLRELTFTSAMYQFLLYD